MTIDTPEFSRTVDLAELERGPVVRRIAATEAERAALARRFALVALDRLEATVRLNRIRGAAGVRLEAHFEAEATQACVVTLEPVPARLAADFTLLYLPPAEMPGEPVELDAEAESVEPLTAAAIDIGEAVAQELSLTLDPYPRKAEAEVPPATVERLDAEGPGLPEEGSARGSAFAALAALKKRH